MAEPEDGSQALWCRHIVGQSDNRPASSLPPPLLYAPSSLSQLTSSPPEIHEDQAGERQP